MGKRVVVITGASAGIGAALAEELTSRGMALTATFRDEVQASCPDIQFTLLSPGVVATEFGVRALHGGPDSREMPGSQSAEEVARVIAWAIDCRLPDVYTRRGSAARIAAYYASQGVDGDPEATLAGQQGG